MVRNALMFFNSDRYKIFTSLPSSVFIKRSREKFNELSDKCECDGMTLWELQVLNELTEMTININDGHIGRLNWEV